MRVLVGTSGYSYKPWKGRFYPEDLKDADMLRYYSTQFPTVEINNTFYRMPTPALLERWAGEAAAGFTFVLKAPQRITHQRRLLNAAPDVAFLFDTARVLGSRLGPVLFQTPPFLKKDAGRLRDFLGLVPAGQKVAFEFRHDSWFDEEVFDVLRAGDAALCEADTDEEPVSALRPTARWGYLRLRRVAYPDEEVAAWAARIQGQPWEEAYVFFKHEDEGTGPLLARKLIAALAR